MRYLLLLLIPLFSLIAKDELCVILEDPFEKYSSQKIEIITPKEFIIGENSIKVVLSKPKMPSGFMVPVIFDFLKSNANIKPEIISGYPESIITIKEKATYEFKIKVNLVYKSSCGGIQFSNLLTKKIKIKVK